MIVQCATFSKSLNPRNIDKRVLDDRIRIRFPFESSFWIFVSGSKLTILQDIQPGNRVVIISAMHEKFLKVYLPVAPDGVLTYGKIKFALNYSNGKGMPSSFSHFYCHRVVLSTQKKFKGFLNISGRLVAAPAQNPAH